MQELAWTKIKRTVHLCTRKDKSLGDIKVYLPGFLDLIIMR